MSKKIISIEKEVWNKLEYIASIRTDVNEFNLVMTYARGDEAQHCMGFKEHTTDRGIKYGLCNSGIRNCYVLVLKEEYREKYNWGDEKFVVGADHISHMVGKEGIRKFKATCLTSDNELMKRVEKNKGMWGASSGGGNSNSVAKKDFVGTMATAEEESRKRQKKSKGGGYYFYQKKKSKWINPSSYDPRDNNRMERNKDE